MEIRFTKMHGLGNDFMLVDSREREFDLPAGEIEQLADRRRGVGFDQLLVLETSRDADADAGADFHYRIFNPDGLEVEHCGNGARCLARFIADKGLSRRNPITVATVNRTLELRLLAGCDVSVNMGRPDFEPAALPFRAARRQPLYERQLAAGCGMVRFAALSMGNPHAVVAVEDLAKTAVKRIGKALGSHADFPAGVNVGFMRVENRHRIGLRVYERGPGETPACGSGACAAAVSGIAAGTLESPVAVALTGGELAIEWRGGDAPVHMSGPAQVAYEGTVKL
ncbi:MAG: diaminopimelate epimerase [Gammaproteobacteria bacterium]|nr:diaminopimelate epimerase [Gammaproteobacteria bacterium]